MSHRTRVCRLNFWKIPNWCMSWHDIVSATTLFIRFSECQQICSARLQSNGLRQSTSVCRCAMAVQYLVQCVYGQSKYCQLDLLFSFLLFCQFHCIALYTLTSTQPYHESLSNWVKSEISVSSVSSVCNNNNKIFQIFSTVQIFAFYHTAWDRCDHRCHHRRRHYFNSAFAFYPVQVSSIFIYIYLITIIIVYSTL